MSKYDVSLVFESADLEFTEIFSVEAVSVAEAVKKAREKASPQYGLTPDDIIVFDVEKKS